MMTPDQLESSFPNTDNDYNYTSQPNEYTRTVSTPEQNNSQDPQAAYNSMYTPEFDNQDVSQPQSQSLPLRPTQRSPISL